MNSNERRRAQRKLERLYGEEADRIIVLAKLKGNHIDDVYVSLAGSPYMCWLPIERNDILDILRTNDQNKNRKAVQASAKKPGARVHDSSRF